MLKKITFMAAMFTGGAFGADAQDSTATSPLQISGSVDTYYKYDFSGTPNIPTSFASDQNSVSLGMIDLALKKTTGKASFVGELSFGPRGQAQSIPNADGVYDETTNSFHIQNLYVNYAFSDKFSMTAGYMGTFIGYEIISPVGNFNYSTSYLFTNGPFQNAGIKGTYAFSSKASLMVGLFNDWNVYHDFNGVSHIGAQLMVAPVEGWTAYFNFLSGRSDGAPGTGTIFDLTTAYQITSGFKLGLNAADYTVSNDNGGYSGVALYPQYAFNSSFSLGLRGEYFKYKDVAGEEQPDFKAITLSGNFKSGGLTFIPEIRFDKSSNDVFASGPSFAGSPNTSKASQFSLAVVYAF
ncbi:outer membrane beta-barrel protein [Pedobacter sp. HMF7647]|uniref:Outer membrane beta-barrel protein n=1 Tax=Hufsiella arboris TaxID=2695275 RepID=A0A7K1YEN8_9SPHI|nr:outer membrane beta-barrel protein [Hufsiella arboris]MXV53065.1 outer membrane beta-barrel protein [Hufsiella arboris]